MKSFKDEDIDEKKIDAFSKKFNLSSDQLEQFKKYGRELLSWNKKVNLTAITDPDKVLMDHFYDSLEITKFVDFNKITSIADIGTGAGFPGIPLKICYPHLSVVLIEVIQKKADFLHHMIEMFDLDKVEVSTLDWRSFIRTGGGPIDLFVARASLSVEELLRVFKPTSTFKNARLIYWASQKWVMPKMAETFFVKEESYCLDNKHRRYIFFANP